MKSLSSSQLASFEILIDNLILKFICKCKGTRIIKSLKEKKNKLVLAADHLEELFLPYIVYLIVTKAVEMSESRK